MVGHALRDILECLRRYECQQKSVWIWCLYLNHTSWLRSILTKVMKINLLHFLMKEIPSVACSVCRLSISVSHRMRVKFRSDVLIPGQLNQFKSMLHAHNTHTHRHTHTLTHTHTHTHSHTHTLTHTQHTHTHTLTRTRTRTRTRTHTHTHTHTISMANVKICTRRFYIFYFR